MQVPSVSCTRPRVYHRPVLPFRPHWDGEIQGYAFNSSRRFWPTLQKWYEWEDVQQEAYVIYMLCERRYSGKVSNPRWFMSLFKSAWHRRMLTLVVRLPTYSLLSNEDGSADVPCADIGRELWEVVHDLPRELQIVLMDICRLRPRFNFSKEAMRKLRVALVQPSTAQEN